MLSEQRRKQLDGIVLQMSAQNAPKEDVQAVVADFIAKFGNEQPAQKKKGFLRSVAEGIAKPFAQVGVAATNFGESVVDLARGDIKGANEALSKERNVPLLGKTKPFATGKETAGGAAKAVLGTGLEIGSTIVGGGGVGAVGKSTVKGLAKQAAKQGAKFGATTGAFSSIGQELQNENSTLGSTIKAGLGGAASGVVIGGALGGATGAVGAGVKNTLNRAKNKVSREAFEIIEPELTLLEKQTALAEGRATKGKFGTIKINPTKRDLQVARAVEGVVSKKKGLIGNIISIRNEIKKEAQATMNGLKRYKTDYKVEELSSKLGSLEKPPLVVSDTRLNNAYDLAQKKFVEFAEKEKNDLPGLLRARQKFDNWIEESFPKIFDDPNNTPLQKALRDMRTSANDFIESKLPAKSQFRNKLRRQSLMYEALDNIANKSRKDVGKSAVQRFMRKHPVATNAAKVAVYGAAGAVGLGKIKEILK